MITINGKTLRGSLDVASSRAAIHMVSAWCSANSISLGQVVIEAKSNEITAIPKLPEMLVLEDAIITIDVMGCQTDTAVVRGHWAIAKELHWQLDVTLGADRCSIRKGDADAKFSALRAKDVTKNGRKA